MDKRVNNHKPSIFNYDANVLSFLIYLIIMIFNFVPFLNYFIFALPLIIYVIEKKSDFVRGHSLQAFVISFFSSIFSLLCVLVSYIAKPRCNATLSFCFGSSIIHKMFSMFGSIRWMFCGFIFVICLVLALRAYNYESYKLEYVDRFIDKIGKLLNKLLGVIPLSEEKEEVTEVENREEPVVAAEPVVEEPLKHQTVRERKKKKKIQRELEETMKLQALEEEKKEESKKETVRERKKRKRIQKELEETMKLQTLEIEKKKEVKEEPVKKTTKKKTNNKNKVTKKSLMKASNKGNKTSSKKKDSKTKSKK